MREGWEAKKIVELCEVKPSKKEARDRLNEDDVVSFVPMEDLGVLTKEFIPSKEKTLNEVSGSYTYFAENDVLLAKITPCFENGKIGIARNLTNGIGFGSSEYFVFRSLGEIIPDYLYYFLSRNQFRTDGAPLMTGAVGHKRVPKDFVEKLKVPYPKDLSEQQHIVASLDEAFDAIARAKENAEKNLLNARELFESYLQSVFANPGPGWEEKKLGDQSLIEIIDGDRGKNYPNKNDFCEDGFCLFMNTKNVRPGGLDFETTMFINEEKDKALGKGKLKRNDVVMTTRGTIGNLGVFNDDVEYDNIRINSGMLIFRPNLSVIIPEYLFEILRSGIIRDQIKKHVSGAAQPQLPIKTLVSFTFPVPKSISEQKHIVAKLDALAAETKKLEAIYQQKLADLEELKQSLLEKAFRGELTGGES